MLSDKNVPVLTGNTTSMRVWWAECLRLWGEIIQQFPCYSQQWISKARFCLSARKWHFDSVL